MNNEDAVYNNISDLKLKSESGRKDYLKKKIVVFALVSLIAV